MKRFITVATITLMLAACQDKTATPPAGDEAQTAEGEVLGGSISDAMLPLDTVTSQPPPLREQSAASSPAAASSAEPEDPVTEAEPEEDAEAEAAEVAEEEG